MKTVKDIKTMVQEVSRFVMNGETTFKRFMIGQCLTVILTI